MKLNSAQHARSAASRLDDVIDRSALEQAREGLGGRDIEEPLIGLEVQKSTLEWCESNHRWAPRVEEHGRARRGETGGRNPVNPARLDTTESSSPMKSVESSEAWI